LGALAGIVYTPAKDWAMMLTRERIVEILRGQQPYLAAEFGVRRMGLFGSFARDEADEDSDVDLVVEFERPVGLRFVDLAEHLERVLGRKVDVLTPAGIATIRPKAVGRRIAENILYV
jgi:uncharacterized protein